jgi:hypothetical protein
VKLPEVLAPEPARLPEPVPTTSRVSAPVPEPELVTLREHIPTSTPVLVRSEEPSGPKTSRQPLWRQAPLSEEVEQDTTNGS